ncbi:hypothetical protein [Serratia nevei]
MARTALLAGVAAASEQAIRQLAFRDFLRKHHGIAEQHKHQAAEDRRQNPAAYGRLKNELVQRHEQPAPAWLAMNQAWTAESTYHHLVRIMYIMLN